jgi:hypothetical protein
MPLVFTRSSDFSAGQREGKHLSVSGEMSASDGKGGVIRAYPRFSTLNGEVAWQAIYCKAGEREDEPPPAGQGPFGVVKSWTRGTKIHVESTKQLIDWLTLMGVDTSDVQYQNAVKEEPAA